MKTPFSRILYGGDYNPNQWPREIWAEDMALFKKAGINSATVNVFSWAKLQPDENTYDFSELDDIIAMLSENGIDIVLATATGAMPAWMAKKYPEVTRVDFEGRRHKFGQRHNHCPNSLVWQKYAARLAGELAKRYGSNPHVVCWHINNEYNTGCYCENCEKAFRIWLREKYGTLEAVNAAWNTEFWGHTFYDWDEIVAPNNLSDGMGFGFTRKTAFAGISIDYDRFLSDSLLENYKLERDAIRAYDKETPITTNLMGTYNGLDYFKWAKEMDIVSWDNYPAYNTPWSFTAMRHDLMRGLKDAPFMLMEQTPSQQNWQPYNSLKKPGQMRAQSYQTVAHGADTIQFFQLRRSKGACEKFHGAVIAHSGSGDTRVFKECSQLGEELKKLGAETLGAKNTAEVGIIFDWDNYWALEYTSGPNVDLKYVDQIHQYYQYFYEHHIPVDMIPVDGDFSRYKAICAPVLYMVKEGVAEALEAFVEAGGTLITGMMSGIVDQSDNVHLGGYPGPLRRLCGIWAEEIDALAPEQSNTLRFPDGIETQCKLLCDIIRPEGAETLAVYGGDFYEGTPAVTKNSFGKGTVYYVGTQPDHDGIAKILDALTAGADVKPLIPDETELEVDLRTIEGREYWFIINLTGTPKSAPESFRGETDILTGEPVGELQGFDTVIVRR
ncbi:beta-galactosidase [Acutalibacter sp. 1XD8-36]|uniref:beta-galactosidase n=1 Tax=Acutalibacter sp. 1XD8-36 TaxID=2320852 RepID=UPI0014131BBE|nr:beta-galactosidase [Acutalibacter sp. 1XD8-36]NBJ90865.1 beta-galactosidase [Acutalibacter sp. 1XD8-36]